MTWSGPDELKAQLMRLWARQELLRDVVSGHSRFPLRLTFKAPGSADITDRFEAVRAWAAQLTTLDAVRLEWQEVRHRVQGTQSLPSGAWVDTLEAALRWLGKRREWERFAALVSATRQVQPALLPWLEKRPLQALALAEHWPRLLAVVEWVKAHPLPGIYVRQVDLPGVHTKFIESHRGVLAELLDLALPDEAVNRSKAGVSQFADRYGFLEKPTRIRFRVLDPEVQAICGMDCPDIGLDAESFSRLQLPVRRIFITENEVNFLAFPRVEGSIVIFGAGYGWETLARGQWLNDCTVYYWGDIDTHGFVILNQLRGHFAHVVSFLMDRETLYAHKVIWGEEDRASSADLARLTADEQALYDDLRDNRIRTALRLEQEQIGFNWVATRLKQLLDSPVLP